MKQPNERIKHIFVDYSEIHVCLVSLKDLAFSDCMIRLYVTNSVYSQLETSGNPKFDPNMAEIVSIKMC